MADFYSVSNWEKIFENNRSKDIKDLHWVAIPNRHDGSKFAELMSHKNGPQHFAAWILIVQVASRCGNTAASRGILRRGDGTPHNAKSLSLITRCPEDVFSEAIPRLFSLGWLEIEGKQGLPHEGAEIPQQGAVKPALQGRGGDGTEGKKEGRFAPPSIEEVTNYCNERKNNLDPVYWVDYYQTRGWKLKSGQKMVDWKAAVRTWENTEKKGFNPQPKSTPRKTVKVIE